MLRWPSSNATNTFQPGWSGPEGSSLPAFDECEPLSRSSAAACFPLNGMHPRKLVTVRRCSIISAPSTKAIPTARQCGETTDLRYLTASSCPRSFGNHGGKSHGVGKPSPNNSLCPGRRSALQGGRGCKFSGKGYCARRLPAEPVAQGNEHKGSVFSISGRRREVQEWSSFTSA